MRNRLLGLLLVPACVLLMSLAGCGGGSDNQTVTVTIAPPEVIVIASVEQFDAEVAKARPGAVVVADFHAEWCGPCKKLAPELNALATAHPGKLFVLKVDVDQQPQLAERFQVESIPLLVKFADGKPTERKVGFIGGEKLAGWLGVQ